MAKQSFVLAIMALALAGCGEEVPKTSNKVVVLLDGSISYRKRQAEAIQRAATLLEAMSQQKVHRWDKGSDQIVLISLDAAPSVLWQGNLKELKALDRNAWANRLRARSDYAGCTDVTTAFRLGVRSLDGDSRYVKKYLFAFTDLLDEPPTDSMSACQAPQRGPAEEFPWDGLRDVSVSVFWMPADQLLVWRREIAAQGMEESFSLYSDSESNEVTIAPPQQVRVVPTAEEVEAAKQSLSQTLKTAALWVGLGLVALFTLPWALDRYRRRRAAPAPAARLVPLAARAPQRPQPLPPGRRPNR